MMWMFAHFAIASAVSVNLDVEPGWSSARCRSDTNWRRFDWRELAKTIKTIEPTGPTRDRLVFATKGVVARDNLQLWRKLAATPSDGSETIELAHYLAAVQLRTEPLDVLQTRAQNLFESYPNSRLHLLYFQGAQDLEVAAQWLADPAVPLEVKRHAADIWLCNDQAMKRATPDTLTLLRTVGPTSYRRYHPLVSRYAQLKQEQDVAEVLDAGLLLLKEELCQWKEGHTMFEMEDDTPVDPKQVCEKQIDLLISAADPIDHLPERWVQHRIRKQLRRCEPVACGIVEGVLSGVWAPAVTEAPKRMQRCVARVVSHFEPEEPMHIHVEGSGGCP